MSFFRYNPIGLEIDEIAPPEFRHRNFHRPLLTLFATVPLALISNSAAFELQLISPIGGLLMIFTIFFLEIAYFQAQDMAADFELDEAERAHRMTEIKTPLILALLACTAGFAWG